MDSSLLKAALAFYSSSQGVLWALASLCLERSDKREEGRLQRNRLPVKTLPSSWDVHEGKRKSNLYMGKKTNCPLERGPAIRVPDETLRANLWVKAWDGEHWRKMLIVTWQTPLQLVNGILSQQRKTLRLGRGKK